MKICLLDFHRKKNEKIAETYKIRDALRVRDSIDIDIYEMLDGQAGTVNLEFYDALVLSGSDSNYLEKYPGFRISKELFDKAKQMGMPVFGICAGFQIIARFFGYRLEVMEAGPEMGWYNIHLSPQGKADPLFKDMPNPFVSFLCHLRRVSGNSNHGVTVLAYNGNCPQGFRFGENIYGIQFHPEDTIAGGAELIKKYQRRPPLQTQCRVRSGRALRFSYFQKLH